jgi:hypothetical protein
MTGAASTRTVSAAIAEAGLLEVFGAQAVAGLREDSPLAKLGMSPDDAVCIADAVARAAQTRSLTCVLGDAELADLVTVTDLIDAVAAGVGP